MSGMRGVFKAVVCLGCIFVLAGRVMATYQRPDLLDYAGKVFTIGGYQNPFEKFPKIDEVRKRSATRHSGLWRRYVARFAIEDGRLVCKTLYQDFPREDEPQEPFCRDLIGGGVFCQWFSGKSIPLREARPYKQAYFLEKKEYALDVENGIARVVVKRENKDMRMSPEDIKRRGGAKYNPDDDNLSDWVEFGYLCFNPRFNEYFVWLDKDAAEKILAQKTVKTRGYLRSARKTRAGNFVSLELPATRTNAKKSALFESAIDCRAFVGKAVEAVVENPLRVSAKIISMRELKNSESVHNARNTNSVSLEGDFEESIEFTKNLFPKVGRENLDESKIKAELVWEDFNLSDFPSLKIRYSAGGGVMKSRHYERLVDLRQPKYDIEYRYPDTDLSRAKFVVKIDFCDYNTPLDTIEKWPWPREISLGGMRVWTLEKELETNALLKFLLAKSREEICAAAENLDEKSAETAQHILERHSAQYSESGREKLRAAETVIQGCLEKGVGRK